MKTTAVLLILAALCGCSPVMEATRPDPVDITQFTIGESRVQVIQEISAPTANVKDGNNSCDVYRLYTRGPGPVTKGAIAVGEAAADVVTLALAEIIFTPMEVATKNSKHTVMMCYGEDNKLAAVRESDTATTSESN